MDLSKKGFAMNFKKVSHDDVPPQRVKNFSRRQALAALGGLTGFALLNSCGSISSSTSPEASPALNPPSEGESLPPAPAEPATPTSCSVTPSETEGPYPASSLLDEAFIYRQNIVEDRTGVPLQMVLNLYDTNNSCAPISNAAVYLWHCDKDGNYSGYGSTTNATFLRGVQMSNATGQVSFQTIFPGWYMGRITHIHFEIFLNNNLNSRPTRISQIAFPQAITQAVYSSSLYAGRGQNTSVTSFANDNVFDDGVQFQLATVSGNTSGYQAQLNVGIVAI